MKIVVIGGVAGGASVAARIRRLDESSEILVLERGEHVSFSNCALPYYLGGIVEDDDSLVMMDPDDFKTRHNIEVRTKNEVTEIHRDTKEIIVHDLTADRKYSESYDKLIIATGGHSVVPDSIMGVNSPHVFTVRNVTDVCRIKKYISRTNVQSVVVVGAGFVGMEVAENLRSISKNIALVEGANQVMAHFDYDMAQYLHKEIIDNKISLFLSSMLVRITDKTVVIQKNDAMIEIPAEAVILAIGVKPESTLAIQAGLQVGANKAIKVNHNYQTNDPDIYAIGDVVETYSRLGRTYGSLALAGPAQRQARAAADHICGIYHNNNGYIGTSCIRVFHLNAAATGMTEKTLKSVGIPYELAYVLPFDKVSIMPEAHFMAFKLLFETPTGRILGAQAIGQGDCVRRIDVIAALILMGGTLEDLKEMELCYSPIYGTAKDVVNQAALVGLNVLYNRINQVHVSEVRDLVKAGVLFIDVREANEYNIGHLKGAKNIPLSEFRTRINEIPKNRPVYLYCRTAQRSYYALCELLNNGYQNAFNVSGSFLGICNYEYFNDVNESRDPIVTDYIFS